MFEILVICAAGLPLFAVFILGDLALIFVDKLWKKHKEKAPRTLACSREQGTKSKKSVA